MRRHHLFILYTSWLWSVSDSDERLLLEFYKLCVTRLLSTAIIKLVAILIAFTSHIYTDIETIITPSQLSAVYLFRDLF